MAGRRIFENPVDLVEDEDDEGSDRSDLYEVRFCEHPDCGDALPLDKPGRYITLYGDRILVCACCHQRETRT